MANLFRQPPNIAKQLQILNKFPLTISCSTIITSKRGYSIETCRYINAKTKTRDGARLGTKSNLTPPPKGLSLLGGVRQLSQTSDDSKGTKFEAISYTEPYKHVVHLELNRPKVKNAFAMESAQELIEALNVAEDDPAVRCLVLSGKGPDFTSGVDLKSFMTVYGQLQEQEDVGRKAKLLRQIIHKFQSPFKRMDSLHKPIVSVQHGLCYGLGMELAACSDIRYCSNDTRYSIREVLIGIAADVGSLQKMPRLVKNQSLLRELVYTGREMMADEALALGFVSKVFGTKEEAVEAAFETASSIAKRSPVAVQGSKQNLKFSEDKSFDTGLEYNAVWNMCLMQSEDVVKAITAVMSRSENSDFDNY